MAAMIRNPYSGIALGLLLGACGADSAGTPSDADSGPNDGSSEGGQVATGALRINEIDCHAATVELVNTGKQELELGGYTLSDDPADSTHRAPVTGKLAPGAYLVVQVTAFGIACRDESLSLLHGEQLSDLAGPSTAPDGASWGRLPDGTGELSASLPTPRAANVAWSDLSVALYQPLGEASQIEMVLSEQALMALEKDPKTYVEGTLSLRAGTQSVGPFQVGVRLKGGLGSFQGLERKPAFKIDADRYVKGQRILGLEKLTLNNTVQDPSTVHEWLGYTVFANVGVPTPRVGFAQVSVNGTDYGAHLLLESFGDQRYVDRNFPSTLAIFEGEKGDLVPEQLAGLELDYGEEAPARAALDELIGKLGSVAPDKFYSGLAADIRFDEVLRMLATDHLLDNGDSYSSNLNNYGVHFSADGQLSLLPWGLDRLAEEPLDLYAGKGLLFLRCMSDLACSNAYLAAMQSVLDALKKQVASGLFEQLRTLGRLNVQRYQRDRVIDASAIPAQVELVIANVQRSIAAFESELTCQSTSGVDGDDDGRKCRLDCQDNEPARYHGAPEICGDEVDQDCNGEADDGSLCGG